MPKKIADIDKYGVGSPIIQGPTVGNYRKLANIPELKRTHPKWYSPLLSFNKMGDIKSRKFLGTPNKLGQSEAEHSNMNEGSETTVSNSDIRDALDIRYTDKDIVQTVK